MSDKARYVISGNKSLPMNVGWAVATVDSEGILHLDWDAEFHTDRAAAVREAQNCLNAGWDTQLLYAHPDPWPERVEPTGSEEGL